MKERLTDKAGRRWPKIAWKQLASRLLFFRAMKRELNALKAAIAAVKAATAATDAAADAVHAAAKVTAAMNAVKVAAELDAHAMSDWPKIEAETGPTPACPRQVKGAGKIWGVRSSISTRR